MTDNHAVIIHEMEKIVVLGTVLLLITGNVFNNKPTYLVAKSSNRTHLLCRNRRTITSIFYELGELNSRRAYRMFPKSFWKLAVILEEKLCNKKYTCTPNGAVTHWMRLSIALRYLAGGQPMDIALVHGVSHSIVFYSLWQVIDAINQTSSLAIKFPESHEEQQKIALDFKNKSSAGFDNCVGAVDGILIWILKPTVEDCAKTCCGPAKFFCGRKKKFGLNMQGTCDAQRRFTDVSICHPGATSDYLSFETSPLKHMLERPGFLSTGMCVFGDNAYVNTPYLATPFKNVSTGPKDSYNYYHSQLRINIECAFGMLVHRFAILRKPIARNISLKKTTAMVMACCKLHNYCITENECSVPNLIARDAANISIEGAIPLSVETEYRPFQLLSTGYGALGQDYNRNDTRCRVNTGSNDSPRDYLLNMVNEKNLARPTPVNWNK
jgi:hypothetical protein